MSSPSPAPNSIIAAVICAALLLAFGLTARLALLHKNATLDEPCHLVAAWVETHLHDFRCDVENPPLWKYYVAVGTDLDDLKINRATPQWQGMLMDVNKAVAFFTTTLYRTPQNNPDALLSAARTRMVLPAVALGALIACWAWRLSGPVAAMVAAAAYCLDPNFLAHSALVKNDVAITLFLVALMMSIWLLGERATFPRWLAMSLLLGAALTTKFSGILAIPMLALALLCRALLPAPWPILNWTARARIHRLAAAAVFGTGSLIVAYVFIWTCYGFRFSISADPDQQFDLTGFMQTTNMYMSILDNNAAAAVNAAAHPNVVFRIARWSLDHRLLPQAWIAGLIDVYGNSHSRDTFLCGELSQTGWWYYFPLAMLFKTPLATLVGLSLAMVFCWLWRRRSAAGRDWWPLCAAAIAPLLYAAVSISAHLNLGLRHILPVYPFLFIFLGVIAAQAYRRRRQSAAVIVTLIVALAVETYATFPDFIPFFNVAAANLPGGKLQLLSDSNLDWGQDLKLLVEWQKQHSDRQLYLCYFGTADPRYYGLHYINVPGSNAPDDQSQPQSLPPVVAISATRLQGLYLSPEHPFIAQFRNRQPLEILGGSIYLYDLH